MGVVVVDVGGAAVVVGPAGKGTFATIRVRFVEVDKTICIYMRSLCLSAQEKLKWVGLRWGLGSGLTCPVTKVITSGPPNSII